MGATMTVAFFTRTIAKIAGFFISCGTDMRVVAAAVSV